MTLQGIFLLAAREEGRALVLGQSFEQALDEVMREVRERGMQIEQMAEASNAASPNLPRSKDSLNERELEILHLVALGLANQQIAERLIVSPSTVKWHLQNLFAKLDVHSRTQALARARQEKLL